MKINIRKEFLVTYRCLFACCIANKIFQLIKKTNCNLVIFSKIKKKKYIFSPVLCFKYLILFYRFSVENLMKRKSNISATRRLPRTIQGTLQTVIQNDFRKNIGAKFSNVRFRLVRCTARNKIQRKQDWTVMGASNLIYYIIQCRIYENQIRPRKPSIWSARAWVAQLKQLLCPNNCVVDSLL